METSKLIALAFGAIFVNNIVFSRFLGLCPFFGVSKKLSSAVGLGTAATFVMVLSVLVIYPLNRYALEPYHLDGFLQLPVFLFVIVALVQLVELLLRRFAPALYQSLGIYLPMITANCAVLGTVLIATGAKYDLLESAVFALAAGAGFTLALIMMASVRERLERAKVPASFQDLPVAFITAGLMALAMTGFIGIFK